MTSLIRLAALSFVLGAFGVGAAYADDEYGVGSAHEQVIIAGAKSEPGAPLNKAQARIVNKMFDYHGVYPSQPPVTNPLPLNHYATMGSEIAAPDVVGSGGPQDETARAIYTPGTGTDW